MNEAKARDVRVYLLRALLMISNTARPHHSDINCALDHVKRAETLLSEMVDEAILEE